MRKLPNMYSKRVKEIKQELAQISHVALTSDIWTSRTTQSYLTLTCHFLTSSWELKTLVLGTFELNNDHTADNIAEALQRVAGSWGISNKVVAMVTDNAANIVAAVRMTGWMHIPCFAHTLNLVVSDAIKADASIHGLKKKCKQIVTFFHHSVKSTEKLKEIQGQLGIPEHKLIQEVETRWNSTYYMFQRITEQHQAVTTALCLANRSDLCLTSTDVELLKAAVAVLKPFEATTREVSADKYVSISKIIPLARSLQHLTSGTDKDITLVTELTAQLRRRFTNIESAHLLAISTLLDPRIKKLAFQDSGAVRQGEQWIIQEMAGLVPADSQPSVDDTQSTSTEKTGLWDLFDAKVAQSYTHRTGTSSATLEARKFFEEQIVPHKDDPLLWWRAHVDHYSLLSQLARKYLCIPGTSVPSERLFSKAGELVSLRRSRIKPKHVNMFLFLNQNL